MIVLHTCEKNMVSWERVNARYQLTLSAYCRSTSLRTACAFAMALAAYEWLVIELQAFCGLTLGKLRCNSLGDWWFRELVRHTQSQPMNERPWVVASARRHATCVGAGRIVGVKLAKHVRPLQFVRLAMRPNSCVSLARRVTSWFTPRLHRNPTSPTSNFPASRNWTCEVVFRVQHGRGGAGESHCQGLGCALL